MSDLRAKLEIERCPHCSVARPDLTAQGTLSTNDHAGQNARTWKFYVCSTCGGVVTAWAAHDGWSTQEIFPQPESVDESIPSTARAYLTQALQSLHTPAGVVMLAASAVDAMLKAKGYKTDSLYKRIQQAASDHLITEEMAKWAHQVRLDANNQRHADEAVPFPTSADARKSVDFAKALAFLCLFYQAAFNVD